MKKVISLTMAMLLSSQALACDFKNDIVAQPDGKYLYTAACHKEVGKRVEALKVREEQVAELYRTIELKDLALTESNKRVKLWMDTSTELNDKLLKYDAAAKTSNTLSFGLGVVATALAVWGAGQLRR
jgi:hypothetical protein